MFIITSKGGRVFLDRGSLEIRGKVLSEAFT